jgi:ribosomal protein S18 acetylase RimI-like enzyme
VIRAYRPADWPALWEILRPIIRAGETYCLPPEMEEAEAREMWLGPPTTRVSIAEIGGQVLGTGHMGPNRPGPGAHVANASYMVAHEAQGRGIGRALVLDSLSWVAREGFAGLQFNAVAETNRGAIKLYRELGFCILGTVPGGFAHPREGRVGLHIMYRAAQETDIATDQEISA